MAEPTVPVPVSLIEALLRDSPPSARMAARREARALLSQPTPTAQAEQVFRCDDCGEEFDYDHYGDVQAHEDATGHDVPSWTLPTAAPPSIAEMAPEHSYEAMRTDIISALAADGFSYLESEQLLRRFESTIRDVTPPGAAQ